MRMKRYSHKKQDQGINKEEEAFSKREYVIRTSICTGEKVAGYRNENGKFTDIMLIRNEGDLNSFCRQYGVNKETLKEIY